MKVKLNKQLMLETDTDHWNEFVTDVNTAASHGTPGVPTITDTWHLMQQQAAAERLHALQQQARYHQLQLQGADTDEASSTYGSRVR